MVGTRLSLFIIYLFLDISFSQGQEVLLPEDTQDVLSALADADMAEEVTVSWQNSPSTNKRPTNWTGKLETRLAFSENSRTDIVSRLEMQYTNLFIRGRVRRDKSGVRAQAFTARWEKDSLNFQIGGLGMSAGYGLLINSPGRSGGLAAAQAFPGMRTKIKGWATAPARRSALGVGLSWQPKGWNLTAMHGRTGESPDSEDLSAAFLEKRWGHFNLGLGAVHMASRFGGSINGRWVKGAHHLGFEGAVWEKTGQYSLPGVWLVSLKSTLTWVTVEAQWAASNSSEGNQTGVRPSVLNDWGGAGWGIRLSSRSVKTWRVKVLIAQSQGVDRLGVHQNNSRKFMDLVVQGRPYKFWNFSARWHQRFQFRYSWSENYPWLPPVQTHEDERLGFTLDLKYDRQGRSWNYSLRSLAREGPATSGRRSLFSVRHRRVLGDKLSLLFSFQSAWGAAVDLVTAINPVRGVLLPRHWGRWSSEILVGLDYHILGMQVMGAFSRREPASGHEHPAENSFWTGARTLW